MDDRQFRALLDLLMCCDPYPVIDSGNGTGEHDMIRLANSEAVKRKFDGWEVAYHEFTNGSLRH